MTATSSVARGSGLRVALGASIGAILGLAIGLISGNPSDALAQSACGPKPPLPPAGSCQSNWFCSPDSLTWEPVYLAAGTACNDGDSCTTNDVCDGSGGCAGTVSCPPGVPGPMSGPTSTVTNGAYTVSWTASQPVAGVSSRFIDRYELFENGAVIY